MQSEVKPKPLMARSHASRQLHVFAWDLIGWLDCRCPLWLARVHSLVLVLRYSTEKRSVTVCVSSYTFWLQWTSQLVAQMAGKHLLCYQNFRENNIKDLWSSHQISACLAKFLAVTLACSSNFGHCQPQLSCKTVSSIVYYIKVWVKTASSRTLLFSANLARL